MTACWKAWFWQLQKDLTWKLVGSVWTPAPIRDGHRVRSWQEDVCSSPRAPRLRALLFDSHPNHIRTAGSVEVPGWGSWRVAGAERRCLSALLPRVLPSRRGALHGPAASAHCSRRRVRIVPWVLSSDGSGGGMRLFGFSAEEVVARDAGRTWS